MSDRRATLRQGLKAGLVEIRAQSLGANSPNTLQTKFVPAVLRWNG